MLPQPVTARTASSIPHALRHGLEFFAITRFFSQDMVDISLNLIALSVDMKLSPLVFVILSFPEVEFLLREGASRRRHGVVGY